MAKYTIIEGTTVPYRFQLLEAGSPIVLTDCTVDILIADKTGTALVDPGTVSIIDETDGTVAFDPTDADVFTAASSPYQVRWKITDTNDDVFYVPTGIRDIWNILGA